MGMFLANQIGATRLPILRQYDGMGYRIGGRPGGSVGEVVLVVGYMANVLASIVHIFGFNGKDGFRPPNLAVG